MARPAQTKDFDTSTSYLARAGQIGNVDVSCFMNTPKLKLIIKLKDGRIVSGTYPWPQAISQLSFAVKHPSYSDFEVENA